MARYDSLQQADPCDYKLATEMSDDHVKKTSQGEITTLKLVRYPKSQHQVNETYGKVYEPTKTWKEYLANFVDCSKSSVLNYLLSLIPIVTVLRSYKVKQYLLGDFLSGFTNAFLHFPQGLAFGLLSSLAPKYGLYNSFFPVLLYMLFGTSHHVSFGTNAVIALFTSELVETHIQNLSPISTANETLGNITSATDLADDSSLIARRAALAAGSSFIVGVMLLGMGVLRLGFITSFLSTSFVNAFTTAAACHILTSQVSKALGVKLPSISGAGKLVKTYIEIFKRIEHANVGTVVVSLICLIILVFFKDFINEKFKSKMKMPVPIDLILVILATVVSYFGRLADNFHIAVVGDIPSGLPVPAFPDVRVDIIGASFVTGILIFVLTISMARICEMKHEYQVNTDQELIAYGVANLGSSFFWCFPSCTAPPRTMILSTLGAKTTLNGIFTAIVMLLFLLVLGQYFVSLPVAVLAIMVIVAVKNLIMQVKQLPNLWRTNRFDFVIWVGTALSGIFIDFPYALYIGVLLCMLTVVFQSRLSESYMLSKCDEENLFLNSKHFPNTTPYQKVTIFKMESSLYFATAESFRSRLYAVTGDPRKVSKIEEIETKLESPSRYENGKEENGIDVKGTEERQADYTMKSKYVIIDCSSVNYIDMNGVNALRQTEAECAKVGVVLIYTRCTLCMLNMLGKSVLKDRIEPERVFPDVVDALHAVDILEKRHTSLQA